LAPGVGPIRRATAIGARKASGLERRRFLRDLPPSRPQPRQSAQGDRRDAQKALQHPQGLVAGLPITGG